MRKFRKWIAGAVAFVLLATTVMASNGMVEKVLNYSDYKIKVNGQEVIATDVNGDSTEPFIIDGSMYVPVRALSDAMGYEVFWDVNEKTAVVNDKDEVYTYDNKNLWYETEGLRAPKGAADRGWNLDTFINSELGEWYITQNEYQNMGGKEDEMNEAVLTHWAEIGMKKELFHADDTDAAKYSVFTPMDMDSSKTYPVIFVNHAGGGYPYQAEWYGYVEEAAERDWIVVCPYWGMNSLKDAANAAGMTQEGYIFKTTYDEVIANYPVDVSRVYVAGISGGGNAAGFMAQEWPELIAAVMPATGAAIQGSGVSSGDKKLDNEKIRQYGGIGLMMGYGLCDPEYRWPISESLKEIGKLSVKRTVEERLSFVNDWVTASGSKTTTTMDELTGYQSQFAAGEKSASVLFGLTFDKEYSKDMNGFTYHFGDNYNEDGEVITRFLAVPLTGHFYTKGWAVEVMDFCEKFSRDPETHMLVVGE